MLIRPSGSAFFPSKKIFSKNPLLKIYTFYTFYSLLLQGLIFDLFIIIHFCFCFIKKHVKYITFSLLSLSHRAFPSCFKLYM
ncbi:hypothetical protein DI291_21360 [Bacillus paralicheniformis]|nr:hypothetical protein DI291_21360 [Bacillus paralicheniformis]